MSEVVPIGGGTNHVLFQGVMHSMAGIRVKEGESFEGALKRFKKKCEKAGILSDLRRHQYFEKPSERRKRKIAAARRKMLKAQALQKD
jgi:small subunit ribosomal protein S21